MATRLSDDLASGWSLYHSEYIDQHQQWILHQVTEAHARFRHWRRDLTFEGTPHNLTWFSDQYNIFSLCAGSQFMHGVFLELRAAIRQHWQRHGLDQAQSLWLQCWANLHQSHEPLPPHNHEWPLHGYISVVPQPSDTVFLTEQTWSSPELYHITNRPGQIYIGPGYRYHAVRFRDAFQGPRLTLGWDLCTTDRLIDHRMGFMPLEF